MCAFVSLNRTSGKQDIGSALNGYVCHAPLFSSPDDAIIVNAHQPAWAQQNPDFIRWVARESPFAHGCLDRGEDELFNHASVLDNKAIGKGGVLWLCKAFRHFEEDTWKPGTWLKLRELGLNGLQAFIGASILSETGQPARVNSHVSLFCYKDPRTVRGFYDEMCSVKKLDGHNVNRGGYNGDRSNWGSLAGKPVRMSDGWGGFTERMKPCEPTEYAAKLREIFEGDPSNVS
ncbi:MAG TPA: hypothetical protein VIY48_13380 [Candidatus Paceibacterota bacterium]